MCTNQFEVRWVVRNDLYEDEEHFRTQTLSHR